MYPTSLFIELIAFIIAIVYLRNKDVTYWRGFILFMLFTVFVEAVGFLLRLQKTNNAWVYNIQQLVWTFYLLYFLHKIFTSFPTIEVGDESSDNSIDFLSIVVRNRNILLIMLGGAYLIFFSFEFYFKSLAPYTQGIGYNAKSFVVSSIILILLSCLYFSLMLKQPGHVNLSKSAEFWFAAGLFFYSFVCTGVFVFQETLSKLNKEGNALDIRYIVLTVVNLVLYACWSFAFRCRYQQTK